MKLTQIIEDFDMTPPHPLENVMQYIDQVDMMMQKAVPGWGGPGPDDMELANSVLTALHNFGNALEGGEKSLIDDTMKALPKEFFPEFENMFNNIKDKASFGYELQQYVQENLEAAKELRDEK